MVHLALTQTSWQQHRIKRTQNTARVWWVTLSDDFPPMCVHEVQRRGWPNANAKSCFWYSASLGWPRWSIKSLLGPHETVLIKVAHSPPELNAALIKLAALWILFTACIFHAGAGTHTCFPVGSIFLNKGWALFRLGADGTWWMSWRQMEQEKWRKASVERAHFWTHHSLLLIILWGHQKYTLCTLEPARCVLKWHLWRIRGHFRV